MDVEFLSRLQFALTIAFHYIFPPFSIGLGLILVILEGTYLRTGDEAYHQATRFWVKVFGLIFSIGVATGIVMEFQFGTNWAGYSRFVGDVFGSALAAEGIFAFFLESGFLAVLLFGWDRVSKRTHFLATVLVAFGATLSAFWIIVANSWQQTPAGYHLVRTAAGALRAEVTDFWAVLFNPSTFDRFTHTIVAAWQTGAFLVLSVAAFYALRRRHEAFVRVSLRSALPVAVVASLLQLVTGHSNAVMVSEHQPAKLAAFEGQYDTAPGDLYLLGWVDEEHEQVSGIALPGMLSLLTHGDATAPVTGLRAFAPEDRPPVNLVFQSYHLMVAIGMALIGISLLAGLLWWRGRLLQVRWLLWVLVFSVLGPQIANQVGWLSAEVGRQPWIVYGELRTADSLSVSVSAGEVVASIALFGLIYLLLFALFVFLLDRKIKHGPVEDAVEVEEDARDLVEGRHRA